MPPTSPRVAQEIFDALLFTPFHENVTVYPDDIFSTSPRRENFQPPMTTATPVLWLDGPIGLQWFSCRVEVATTLRLDFHELSRSVQT